MALEFDGSYLAAHTALFALHSTVPEPGPFQMAYFLVAPGTSALEPTEAARILAGAPKPVVCTAESDGRHVLVRCRGITDPVELDTHTKVSRRTIAGLRAEMARVHAPSERDPVIEVRRLVDGRVPSPSFTLVPLSAIESWLSEYRIPMGLLLDAPDSLARQRGATAVLFVGEAPETRVVVMKE